MGSNPTEGVFTTFMSSNFINPVVIKRIMKIPDLGDPDLAYETGLHIGDGCLSKEKNHTYRFAYYGNNLDERDFLINVVIPLIEKLYGFKLRIQNYKNTCFIRVCSKDLLLFKSKIIGLPVGKKDKLHSLPVIFMSNNIFARNLIAGLFDSDGSIYLSRNKYPRISLTLKNKKLIKEVHDFLNDLKIKSLLRCDKRFDNRVNKHTTVWILEINGLERFHSFLNQIPIKNPKFLNRIKSFGLN